MSSGLLEYLARNLSADDIVALCDHVDSLLDADDVTAAIRASGDVARMLRALVDFWWRQDGATMALLLTHMQRDYNFLAFRIRSEYSAAHSNTPTHELNGAQLLLVCRPPDPVSCHPMSLAVPSEHHEQWDHVITWAYSAPRTSKLHYHVKAELRDVTGEDGHVIPAVAAETLRCAEKCRTESSDGTVPHISLCCRFKGCAERTTQTVIFTLQATAENGISIDCASVSVNFQVKRKRSHRPPPYGQPYKKLSGQPSGQSSGQPYKKPSGQPSGQPSGKPSGQLFGQPDGKPDEHPDGQPCGQPSGQPSHELFHTECDSSDTSRGGRSMMRHNHVTALGSDSEGSHMHSGMVSRNFQGDQHCLQLFIPISKNKAYTYERNFGANLYSGMFKMFVSLMQKPQEFDALALRMKQYFTHTMPHSDNIITIQILECTRAYAAGDVEKSYQISKQTKQLLSKARNSAVGVAEVNIQLIGAYRRQRQFGLALQMVQEAQQALSSTELCQTHAMVCKSEATLYNLMLQTSRHPNTTLKKKAIELYWKAIDILQQTANFHASPEHHIKDCYLQLAEVYVDIPVSDMRAWRPVSGEDMEQAELCLAKAQQMISADFYGRGRSKLQLTRAKLLLRTQRLMDAAHVLQDTIRDAHAAGALIDAQFCQELLDAITASPEYALNTLRQLAEQRTQQEDGDDGAEASREDDEDESVHDDTPPAESTVINDKS